MLTVWHVVITDVINSSVSFPTPIDTPVGPIIIRTLVIAPSYGKMVTNFNSRQ